MEEAAVSTKPHRQQSFYSLMLDTKLLGFESMLCRLPAVRLWEIYLTSLRFCFLISKTHSFTKYTYRVSDLELRIPQ